MRNMLLILQSFFPKDIFFFKLKHSFALDLFNYVVHSTLSLYFIAFKCLKRFSLIYVTSNNLHKIFLKHSLIGNQIGKANASHNNNKKIEKYYNKILILNSLLFYKSM